jgi:hypothetical protein
MLDRLGVRELASAADDGRLGSAPSTTQFDAYYLSVLPSLAEIDRARFPTRKG